MVVKINLTMLILLLKKSDHNDIKVISIVKGINRLRATETIIR